VLAVSFKTIPLTGVGKVFKPPLSWDAANRLFASVPATLRDSAIDCKVKVGAHGSHGSIANVTLTGVPADKREAVTGEVNALLAPFVMRHEVRHV